MLTRNEFSKDHQAISRLHHAAFKGHPQHAPGAEPTEHLIVERLRADRALAVSLVAESEGELVGHIAISPAQIGAVANGWYLLGPIGVLPSRQRSGIGSTLMREAIQMTRELGGLGIVLVGDPNYYQRFGFRSMEGLSYPGVPGQYVLGLAFTDTLPQGDIRCHPAFG